MCVLLCYLNLRYKIVHNVCAYDFKKQFIMKDPRMDASVGGYLFHFFFNNKDYSGRLQDTGDCCYRDYYSFCLHRIC